MPRKACFLSSDESLLQIAVVVFPDPHELTRRMLVRTKEMGKEVPDDAVHDMLGILPNFFNANYFFHF